MATNYKLQHTGVEIDNLLNKVKEMPEDVSTLKFEIITELPTANIDNSTIYLIKTDAEDYNEWIYINGTWEMLGTTAVDLTGYATEEYVNTQIRTIEIPSVEGLASEQYVNTELEKKANVTQLNGLATESYVNTQINAIEIPSIQGLASETYVNNAISSKADKTYVDTELGKKANASALNDLATESYVDTKIANLIDSAPETLNTLGEIAAAVKENDEVIDTLNAAIGTKANKSEIPSLTGYATETYVTNAISSKVEKTYVDTELEKKANKTEIPNLTNYATKEYVDSQLGNQEVGSHTQSASTITAGTFAAQVAANATASTNLGVAQIRNISIGTTDLTPGVSALSAGEIYFVYE